MDGYPGQNPRRPAGRRRVFRQLKKALMERALGAELTHHLGYEKGAVPAGLPGPTAATAIPPKPS